MPPIPGRTCGTCTMCCKVLEIDDFEKPAGAWCHNCIKTGGCAIYAQRPAVCREFECLWLTERTMPVTLKPEKIGTILMEEADGEEYQAVCDPEKPFAWRHPLVFKHLVAKAKEGRTVVARAGLKAWRVFDSGECAPWV